MVIQRRRTSSGSLAAIVGPIAPLESTNQISSSDDNDSNGWEEKKNLEDSAAILKSLNDRLARSQVSEKGVTGSLELLRMNLQSSFDKEVAMIVQGYKEKYFSKAFSNLKANLGAHAVKENDLLEVLHKMVQTSANQFNCTAPASPSCKLLICPSTTSNPGPLFDFSDSEEGDSLDTIPTSLPLFNTTFQKYSPFPVWKSSSSASEQVAAAQKRKRAAQGEGQATTTASKKQSVLSSFDILHSTLTRPSSSTPQWTCSKVTWNTSALTKDTQFVLDTQANKLFGSGMELTVKHPELIHYAPDAADDLSWLVSERIIPTTQRNNCNVQLLVRDEVVKLKQREQPEWNGSSFMGFKVPEFMLKKMHKYFTELSIKNQKIRMNSGYFDTVTKEQTNRSSASNLSTSHATLSALLANCSDVHDNN